MIDQASVVAAQHRGNRQPLQAAVLGQSNAIDPYTALRALQLLKESDAAMMAQQARQPTESPSLLQEAMQPPPGMMVPNQGIQAPAAPQQARSGGLEAMAPDQDYADGGIVAFANEGSVDGGIVARLEQKLREAKARLDAAARSGDEAAVQRYVKEFRDTQNTLKAWQGQASGILNPSQPPRQYAGEPFASNVEISPYGGDITPPLPADKDYSVSTRIPDSFDASKITAPEALYGVFNPSPSQLAPGSASSDAAPADVIPASLADQYAQYGAGRPAPAALAASPAASGAPASAPAPAPAPADPSVMTPEAWAKGLDRQTGANVEDAGVPRSTGLAGLVAPQKPVIEKTKEVTPWSTEKREKETETNYKLIDKLMGTDEGAVKAQSIIDKRLKDLEDPTRNSFDQALAWFKGAAAFQKGSRALPAMAEAFAEVASGYSAIKKEDRKARELVEAAELDLAKARQARKDGNSKLALEETKNAEAKQVKAIEIENKNIEHGNQVNTQLYNTMSNAFVQTRGQDSVAETARRHDKLISQANTLREQGLINDKAAARFTAASELYRKARDNANDMKESKAYIQAEKDIATWRDNNSPQGKARYDSAVATKNRIDANAAETIRIAGEQFETVAKSVMGGKYVSPLNKLNPQDQQALEWAKNNKNDPRAAQILQRLGMR